MPSPLSDRLRRSRSLPAAIGGLCLLGAAVIVEQTYRHAYRQGGYDLTARLEQTRAFVHGVNPYTLDLQTLPLTYPLFHLVFLLPFAFMPYALANVLWFALNAACLWWSVRFVIHTYDAGVGTDALLLILAGEYLILFNVIQNNFTNGQTNFVVLALCLFSFRCLVDAKPAQAGLALAAGIGLKLTPVLLLPYFLFRRAWSALTWTIAWMIVLLMVTPALAVRSAAVAVIWSRGYFVDYVLARVLSSGAPRLSRTFALADYLHMFTPFGGAWLPIVATCMALGPLAVMGFRRALEGSPRQQVMGFSAALLPLLWLSPVSETHHLAMAFPAISILLVRELYEMPSPRSFVAAAAIIGLLWLGKFTFAGYFGMIALSYILMASSIIEEPTG